MRKVKVFWHNGHEAVRVGQKVSTPNGRWFCRRHLPVRQTLIWMGPVFVLIQPRRMP